MYGYINRQLTPGKTCRSDLAAERRRADTGVGGIDFTKEARTGCEWERIRVYSEEGEESIGRPRGYYSTLNLRRMDMLSEEAITDAGSEIASELCRMVERLGISPCRILVAGLGNRKLTADAVGPRCAEYVRATMHIRKLDPATFEAYDCSEISVLAPGVTGDTGIEPGEIVRGMCERLRPELVIAIDSLCSASCERVGTTVQICDTGIFPGSGIGASRQAINRVSVGVPVIAIGVPTVIDSRVYVLEKAEKYAPECVPALEVALSSEDALFVSPRDIEIMVDSAARIVASGINQAFGFFD